MLQNATLLRTSAPWPRNSSDEHVSCTALAIGNASLQILFKCPTPAIVFQKGYKTLTFCSLLTRCTIPCACHAKRHMNVQKWSEHGVFCTFWLRSVLRATTACAFSTSQLLKVLRSWSVLYILTSKYASRHNGAPFQPRNFQKRSEHLVFCAFWLGNVLRATTACNCSSLIWPDGSAPTALASLLFNPPEPQIIGKHRVLRLSYLFAHLHLLSFDSFSSLIFSLLLFSSLWLFPSLLFICPYCRKFDF